MPEPAMDGAETRQSIAREGEGGAALITLSGHVLPEWVDVNGHMNVSFYDRVFDEAEHTLFASFGIQDDYIRRTGFTIFRLDKLIRYERDLKQGDAIVVRSTIVWTDFRRVQAFHELVNVDNDYRAATKDALSIHVDLSTRRSAIVTDPEVRVPLERIAMAHRALPTPLGRVDHDGFWRSRR